MAHKKRSRAVITMAQNEAVFLPVWWKYYIQFFQPEDIYIIDHDTVDGSTSGPGFVRIPVSHPVTDWAWHRDMLQAQQHRLIQQYDMVLCTDVDEIVAPDPATGNLGDYMDRFEGEFVNCCGYEVLHMNQLEAPLDFSRSILQQRAHWYFNPVYSKPLLATVPMHWHGGLHTRVDGRTATDDSLYLIHLHRADYDICHHRHCQRSSQAWNQRDVDQRWGYQNRITEAAQFKHWFYNDSCSGTPIRVEQIPERWRSVI